MQLDELKKSMSLLEQMLATANPEINIDVRASQTAQGKILRKFHNWALCYAILAVIFIAAAISNINPESFPNYMKIYLAICLALASLWYMFLHKRLKRIEISAIPPALLFSKTAHLKLLMISGEIVLGMALVVFFTIQIPLIWNYNRLGFWLTVIALPIVVAYTLLLEIPRYLRLFRDLNSLKN